MSALDLEGHRGARGLSPENSLPAFATALSIGVTTLELDVGVTADDVVIVMHDRALNPATVRDASGRWLPRPGPDVHTLEFSELSKYDVGRIDPRSSYAKEFPLQEAVDGTRVPHLEQVFQLAEKAGNDVVQFNIEAKVSPEAPHQTLTPEAFADVLIRVVREYGFERCVIIQCFDWRVLQHTQRVAPEIRTSYLTSRQSWLDNLAQGSAWTAGHDVDDHGGSVPAVIESAGGTIWSPFYREVGEAEVRDAHARRLTVIVWTVNEPVAIRSLIELGVDGIISDYPTRLRQVAVDLGLSLPVPTPVEP